MNKRLHIVLLILLLLSITLLEVAKIGFTHTHVLSDGTTVTHWHIYNNSENNEKPFHTHHDFSKIDLYKFEFIFFIAIVLFNFFVQQCYRKRVFYVLFNLLLQAKIPLKGRAPPYCLNATPYFFNL